jgi:ferric-dicitrate binding protein FerR (iron transport regulator)
LYEGLVRVQNERDTLLINPTQAAEWTNAQSQIARINDANEGLYADWREGLLRFVQQNASDIIPELEQHFNINIALPEKQQSMQLSGSIRLQEVDESLNYLGLLLGGRFEQVEENAYRFIEE